MIDLTNNQHKRGVMILSSKDVRTIDNSLFDWVVQADCMAHYLAVLRARIDKLDIDPSIKDQSFSDIDFCLEHIEKGNKLIDKAREVFR